MFGTNHDDRLLRLQVELPTGLRALIEELEGESNDAEYIGPSVCCKSKYKSSKPRKCCETPLTYRNLDAAVLFNAIASKVLPTQTLSAA